jgi:beta-glucosidase
MRKQLGSRLPPFTKAELCILAENKPKWYGMNHYTAKFARAEPDPPASTDFMGNVTEHVTNKAGIEIGPQSGVSWLQVCPEQFRKILNWVWNRYGSMIIVTENGCPCPGEDQMDLAQSIEDDFRVKYFELYLDAISKAINEDGIKVGGYFAWSLMDNFGKFIHYLRILRVGLKFCEWELKNKIADTV